MSRTTHILLVDDEQRFTDSLAGILTYYKHVCSKAHTGTQAVELLGSGVDFDLVLLDVELPDISGCDLAGQIRERWPATTVIMLTGARTVETAVQAMKQGAYDFLSKPLDHKLLLRTIEKGLQHNRLKRELANSEQKFKTLSAAAWEGIAIHENGRIVEANSPFLEMFGLNIQDLSEGLELDRLLDGGHEERGLPERGEHSAGASLMTGRKKDGTQMPVEVRSRSLDYHNKPMRVLAVRDLTERLRVEQENLDLQKRLGEANKLNALGLMAGSVAHDLNNILTGIVSYPDLLLLQMDKSDKHYDQIRKIQAAGKRAAAVVSDLVAITRGRTQKKSVECVNDLILNYLNSLEHSERLAHYPEVEIRTSLRQDILNVCCSPQHIHKLLLNLVGNALEAVEKKGMVQLSTENCLFDHPLGGDRDRGFFREYVKLTVADNGPGIAEKDVDQIFNPFYSTKVMGKSGTGLGLSVVWNIVQDHNGWIEVKDNGPGAVFEVYLPATRDQVCLVDMPSREVDKGNGERILIVDDQAEQNEILEDALNRLGYAANSVTSGEAAIDFLKSQPVDLILMDMIMGDGLGGRETLEIIQKAYPGQKAVVVSGFAKREEIEKTRALGVSHFLEKPVTISRISSVIQQSLTRN